MQLRYYQEEAIHAIRNALIDGTKRPMVCLPTGSGKSPTICTFLAGLHERFPHEKFVVAVHTKELVEQLAKTFQVISGKKPAVYSASLKSRKIGPVTFAQIQSIYKRATEFGRIKLLIVDEADRIPVEGDGQYRTFCSEASIINPDLRVCGFTATPYRTSTGLVYGDGQPFDSLVYDIGVKQLIDDGFLSKLVSKDGGAPTLDNVHVRQGEYIQSELETVMTDEGLVEHGCDEIIRYGHDRRGWLVFASGMKHATLIREKMLLRGIDLPIIEGKMNQTERDNYVAAFKRMGIRGLININVLSVGFDAPHVDLLALMRPTLSPGLYYQQVGRGFRICEGKTNCLVLDLAGNIAKHGPIDTLNERITTKKKGPPGEAPVKTCERCMEIVPAGVRKCPVCGNPFPELRVAKHDAFASSDSPISSNEIKTLDVERFGMTITSPRDPAKVPTLKVTYHKGLTSVSEWLSIDSKAHQYARQKALAWLRENPLQTSPEGYRLEVEGNNLIGHTPFGERVIINTAMGCVPFLACISKPLSIRYQTDPNGGKYPRVLSRSYEPR